MRAGDLDTIIDEIQRALGAQLWYAALVIALTIPDICSLLPEPPGTMWSSRKKYANWFDRYVAPSYDGFTGDDCYSIRGGVVHHGKFGHKQLKYDRIAFHIPVQGLTIKMMIVKDCGGIPGTTLSLDLGEFCKVLIEAAKAWYIDVRDDQNVAKNMKNLVRYRAELEGHSRGMPLIA